jgi:flavin reductase (DIM6/NTAB) family NADH-FMN oxidoreductase RutF
LTADAVAETLAGLWSPLLAITTHHQGRSNGMVAATGVCASVVPEAPRVAVEITKTSLTHDLILASRVFALHALPATPDDTLTGSLPLVRRLGMRSGLHGDKLAGLPATPGLTGSPILRIFLADVVGGGRHGIGELLTLPTLRRHLPKEWVAEWATSREHQVSEARRRRGIH